MLGRPEHEPGLALLVRRSSRGVAKETRAALAAAAVQRADVLHPPGCVNRFGRHCGRMVDGWRGACNAKSCRRLEEAQAARPGTFHPSSKWSQACRPGLLGYLPTRQRCAHVRRAWRNAPITIETATTVTMPVASASQSRIEQVRPTGIWRSSSTTP